MERRIDFSSSSIPIEGFIVACSAQAFSDPDIRGKAVVDNAAFRMARVLVNRSMSVEEIGETLVHELWEIALLDLWIVVALSSADSLLMQEMNRAARDRFIDRAVRRLPRSERAQYDAIAALLKQGETIVLTFGASPCTIDPLDFSPQPPPPS